MYKSLFMNELMNEQVSVFQICVVAHLLVLAARTRSPMIWLRILDFIREPLNRYMI